jgi:hypothetical protein
MEYYEVLQGIVWCRLRHDSIRVLSPDVFHHGIRNREMGAVTIRANKVMDDSFTNSSVCLGNLENVPICQRDFSILLMISAMRFFSLIRDLPHTDITEERHSI